MCCDLFFENRAIDLLILFDLFSIFCLIADSLNDIMVVVMCFVFGVSVTTGVSPRSGVTISSRVTRCWPLIGQCELGAASDWSLPSQHGRRCPEEGVRCEQFIFPEDRNIFSAVCDALLHLLSSPDHHM